MYLQTMCKNSSYCWFQREECYQKRVRYSIVLVKFGILTCVVTDLKCSDKSGISSTKKNLEILP